MNTPLSQLSPYVLDVLQRNHFEPVQIMRYGPRFFVCTVNNGDVEGLFKMVLPTSERQKFGPTGYVWTEFDDVDKLGKRLLKEALFLQFFSQAIDNDGFEPRIIALSETSPVWSLRTFIREKTMSAWDSDFVFSPRFFKAFEPRQAIDFFRRIHEVSPTIPENLTSLITNYTTTLKNHYRFDTTRKYALTLPQFRDTADHMLTRFDDAAAAYARYEPVITHYEPYPPHIFGSDHRFGLIDWENVGWGHKLQDLSVLYMRCFAEPAWQEEYIKVMDEYGYFQGDGQLYWESELLIQSFANHRYFAEGGPIGTPEYDKIAVKFFEDTITNILKTSKHFGA